MTDMRLSVVVPPQNEARTILAHLLSGRASRFRSSTGS